MKVEWISLYFVSYMCLTTNRFAVKTRNNVSIKLYDYISSSICQILGAVVIADYVKSYALTAYMMVNIHMMTVLGALCIIDVLLYLVPAVQINKVFTPKYVSRNHAYISMPTYIS